MTSDPLRIMVVEDDPKVAHSVTTDFGRHGYQSIRCGTAADAVQRFESDRVDIVVLDLGLPDSDGLEVLKRIRVASPNIPVLILTARDAISDRVNGLEAGADDYLVKPFSLAELAARVKALARRVELGRQPTLHCEDLELDATTREVTRAGTPIRLSPREFDLLHFLMEHQGEVVTRSMLARDVWKYHSRTTPIDNVIDVQMSRLRDKVDQGEAKSLIRTVRGMGFILRGGE